MNCFCDVHNAWRKVREARTYQQVIDSGNDWLLIFWPKARMLGVAAKTVANHPVPFIRVDYAMSAAGTWNGRTIAVMDQERWSHSQEVLKHQDKIDGVRIPVLPLRDELRQVILHEVRHALDEPNAAAMYGKQTDDRSYRIDHNHAFTLRLRKLERLFPWDGA